MAYQGISYTIDGKGIAIITLSQPKAVQVSDPSTLQELIDLLGTIAFSREIRAVILTGEERSRSPGEDGEPRPGGCSGDIGSSRHRKAANAFIAALEQLNKPVIAAIHGLSDNTGMQIALAADIAIASTKTVFSEPMSQVGMIPDLGVTYLLPRLVGKAKAKELLFTQHKIDAQEALRLGLVNQVVLPDAVLDTAYALAEKIAQGPPFAFHVAKKMMNRCYEMDLHTALHMETLSQTLAECSNDYAEGLAAWLEKRKPDFKGD